MSVADASGREQVEAESVAATAARCIGYFAQQSGVHVDHQAMLGNIGKENGQTIATLVKLARDIGVDFAISTVGKDDLERLDEPALVQLTDGRFAVVLGLSGSNVALYGLRKFGISMIPLARFAAIWTGTIARCAAVEPEAERTIRLST